MSGHRIRFLTSVEKMSSLGKHSRTDDRMEGDPNAFISVLINGNCFQVKLPWHPSNVRLVLTRDSILVPGQIRLQRRNRGHRSCHGTDSRYRHMAAQVEFRGDALGNPHFRPSRMAQRCLF